jgi:hypothetical protein
MGVLEKLLLIAGIEQDPQPLPRQGPNPAVEGGPGRRVHPHGRIVQEEEARPSEEGPAQEDFLLITAREAGHGGFQTGVDQIQALGHRGS